MEQEQLKLLSVCKVFITLQQVPTPAAKNPAEQVIANLQPQVVLSLNTLPAWCVPPWETSCQ